MTIRASVKPDSITCLECGRKMTSLRRHIGGHDLTDVEYRTKWKLAADYPMVAPDYSKRRSEMALAIGLGRKAAPEPASVEAPARKRRLSVFV